MGIAERFDMIAANLATGLLGRMDEAKITRVRSMIMLISGTDFLTDAAEFIINPRQPACIRLRRPAGSARESRRSDVSRNGAF
jgi:hypothetical protein